MEFALVRSLLLLTTGIALSMAAAIGGFNDVITSETTFIDKNGTEVSEMTEVDVNCNMLTSVAEYGEDSSSTIINDYKEGLSLVTLSEADDVCYVRNLSATEKRQAASCRYGSMKVSSGKANEEEKDFETSEEISIDQLSPILQEQCQGKKVILLTEATGTPSNQVRQKRGCISVVYCSYFYYGCYTLCWPCYRYCKIGVACGLRRVCF